MTTPNRKAIIERAIQLFHNERAMNGDAAFDITPTEQELRENGFLSAAQSELMRNKHRSEIERDFIDFPEAFTVDIPELFESGGLILGSKHTGKSDVGMMISQKAVEHNAIVVVFDPSLDWIERSDIRQYMKVETHTRLEIPTQNTIYDMSLLSPVESQKIVEDFSEKLFESQAQAINRKQYLVIFEESHVYFPQGCMKAKRMQNSVKMLSVGRNVDIAALLISQFASMLDKFAIKHSTSQAWFGYTKEPNDLKYLHMILGETSEQLPKLNDGEFLYLTRNGISKIATQPYENITPKTQIAIPKPMLESIKPISHDNNAQAIASLISAFLWFILVIMAISSMW